MRASARPPGRAASRPFVGADEGARKAARRYAEYYVGMLRENGGKSADCRAQ